MYTIVVGGSGATGREVVKSLLAKGKLVKVVVRDQNSFVKIVPEHSNLTVIEGSILDFNDNQFDYLLKDCDSIVSCLGHNLTFKGMYGNPRYLVRDAVKKFTNAILRLDDQRVVKYILMNTTGNRNRDIKEKIPFIDLCMVALIRILIPPHRDNESAADYLRCNYYINRRVEWVAVRPDSLIDKDEVTEYTIHPSPTRSAIFDSGKSSRINVAHFMSELVTDSDIWEKWKGQMPVLYNRE